MPPPDPGPQAAASRGRFAGLEGLRGLAAGGVLLSHVYLYASPDGGAYDLGAAGIVPETTGVAGVVLFFTLSGFLLYRPFAASLLTGRARPDLRAYLRNRFLRIVPGYWLALLGAGLVLQTTYLPPLQVEGQALASEPGVLLANLFLVQGYSPATLLTGIGPTWSLAVELVFYLSLPGLAALGFLVAARTKAGRRRPWLAALVPAALLLVLGQLGHGLAEALPAGPDGSWAGSWHAVVSRSFLAQAGLFAAGLALAVVHVQVSRGVLRLPRRWHAAAGTIAVVLLVLTSVALYRSLVSEHHATLLLSLGFALVLALVVLPGGGTVGPLRRALASRPLQWSGLISYGVFLWNEPLVWWLNRLGATVSGPLGFLLALVATIVLAGLVALVSWRLVERPALSLKRSAAGVQTEGGLGSVAPPPLSEERNG